MFGGAPCYLMVDVLSSRNRPHFFSNRSGCRFRGSNHWPLDYALYLYTIGDLQPNWNEFISTIDALPGILGVSKDGVHPLNLEVWYANMEPKMNKLWRSCKTGRKIMVSDVFFQILCRPGSILGHQTSALTSLIKGHARLFFSRKKSSLPSDFLSYPFIIGKSI